MSVTQFIGVGHIAKFVLYFVVLSKLMMWGIKVIFEYTGSPQKRNPMGVPKSGSFYGTKVLCVPFSGDTLNIYSLNIIQVRRKGKYLTKIFRCDVRFYDKIYNL